MGELNRRKFLAWLGGTAAGVAAAPLLDLDKLLWTPGEKKVFLPSANGIVKFTAGDIFTLDGVFARHPLTGQVLPILQQFVVTAHVTSNGKWDDNFPMWPQPIERGIYRNVSRRPVLNQKFRPIYIGECIGRQA